MSDNFSEKYIIPTEIHKSVPIYRLCRDKKSIDKIKKEAQAYGFNHSIYYTGMDYYDFLNKIINECKGNYALVCHDDVVLPIDINEKINVAINKANVEFGYESWGVIGNAGVEFLSLITRRSLKDPHSSTITSSTKNPVPVVSIDGNTLLLNVSNLRAKNISLPSQLTGFHLYDQVLLIECYNHGLVCAMDSILYVVHKSGGNLKDFQEYVKKENFSEYWRETFSDEFVTTINGTISIKKTSESLNERQLAEKKDFKRLALDVLNKVHLRKTKKRLYVITRTKLAHVNRLKRCLDKIRDVQSNFSDCVEINSIVSVNGMERSIAQKYIKDLQVDYHKEGFSFIYSDTESNQYPRVYSIKNALGEVSHDDAFVLILDDDDYISDDIFQYLSVLLKNERIIVGDSMIMNEEWEGEGLSPISSKKFKTVKGNLHFNTMTGSVFMPMSSVIYPIKVLRKVFEYKLKGDYFEDYTIFLISQLVSDVFYYPLIFSYISYHGDNTVHEKSRTHWDYSYATFISEVVNSGMVRSCLCDSIEHSSKYVKIIEEQENSIKQRDNDVELLKRRIAVIENSKFWKLQILYLKLNFALFSPGKFIKKYFNGKK